jgi:hypothetical protein
LGFSIGKFSLNLGGSENESDCNKKINGDNETINIMQLNLAKFVEIQGGTTKGAASLSAGLMSNNLSFPGDVHKVHSS